MIRLEDFGAAAEKPRSRDIAEELKQVRDEAHALGFAEGFAQATETAEAEDQAAVTNLRESIQDLELSHAAARAEALAALRPLIEALARVAAPRAAAAGFDAALADAVEAQLKAAPDHKLLVRAAPDRVEGLKARFGDRVRIAPDPDMVGAVARIEWAGGGAAYDVEACLEAARSMIAQFFGKTGER